MMRKGTFSIFKTRKERTRYRIMSIIEGMVLVSKLAFFFLCCGCRF
ncbi:unnamed protein product [Brassica oleracea var. botrytis]|uniref:Uncharacterized protein n=1 Tax=Brassica oleracea TaxID=3712 RepID=A0A3P6DMW2_BRAOL|nr:unnamed protein product [Brassica oleracea]